LNFVVSSILAATLLGEVLTARKIIGLLLCSAAILTLFLSSPSSERNSHSGLLFSIPACLLAGGHNVLIKLAFNNGAFVVQLILYRYLIVMVLAAAYQLLNHRQSEADDRRIYLLALLSAAAMLFGLFFTFAALEIGDVALVVPIIQLGFVFAGALALLLFKERYSSLKIIAIGLAIASIVAIS
jgi:drug/metabolite transporter (DMT)-like permease